MTLTVRFCSATLGLALLSACSSGAAGGNAAAVIPAAARVAPGIAFHPGNQRRLGSGWQGPSGIAIDPATRDVYVSESFYGTVKKVAADGTISVLAKGLKSPYGLAFDPKTNDVYVAEHGAQQVVAIAPDGTVKKIASGFSRPIGVSIDPSTRAVYVADNGDNSIYEVARDGKVSRIATVQNPGGVAVDGASNDLYIAGSNKVFRLKPDGQLISIGEGWNAPTGIAVDPSTHYVYVADYAARAVKEIGPDGTIATVSFSFVPWNVAVDKETHDIYATDKIADAVWRLDASGQRAIDVIGLPERIAYDSVAQQLYAISRADHMITRVDADGKAEVIYRAGGAFPNGIDVDTGSHDVYFTTEQSGLQSELKKMTPDGKVSTIYNQPSTLYDVAVSSHDHVVYVVSGGSQILAFKDDKLSATIGAPGGTESMTYDPKINAFYATRGDGVFKIKDGSIQGVGKGWSQPRAIAVDSTTGNVYVVDGDFRHSIVKKLTPDGTTTTVADTGNVCLGLTLDDRTRDLYASDFDHRNVFNFVRALNL